MYVNDVCVKTVNIENQNLDLLVDSMGRIHDKRTFEYLEMLKDSMLELNPKSIVDHNQKKEAEEYERLRTRKRQHKAHVYLINILDTNNYKIGISKNVKGRLSTLQNSNPVDMHIVSTCLSRWARRLEKELHQVFLEKRIRGEWFNLSENDVKYIINLFDKENGINYES